MQTEIFDKEVLQKLGDKHLREKAWKIYISNQSWNKAGDRAANGEDIDKKEIERIESKIKMNSLNSQNSFKKELIRKLTRLRLKKVEPEVNSKKRFALHRFSKILNKIDFQLFKQLKILL